jgi:DNA topoisomerase-1
MAKTLIIVESPTKIKALKKFLGPKYLIESSLGHVRDLPQKEFGVDVEHNFEPTYVVMPDKSEVIKKLVKAAKQCDTIYLSPDPDREGEAIAWHIMQILPQDKEIKRVSFNSITKGAVLQALEEPKEINMALVNAQQARRILDRLVGYSISPILNRRIQRGKSGAVSAGRVQSVALKLVVVREREIEAFVPQEYWNIDAELLGNDKDTPFIASLHTVDGRRVEKEAVEGKDYFLIDNKEIADKVAARIEKGPFVVQKVEKKEKKRNPPPPFITSTLQQEASRHFGFSAARTMNIAQTLYEGVDLGSDGTEGLITYMRTDSVRSAPEAVKAARSRIAEQFGAEYVPEEQKYYASKKSAQDAHEAIRPTNVHHTPQNVQAYLTKDQFQLYQLVWRRFIASQMVSAVYDTVSCDISASKDILMRATGSVIRFRGHLAAYEEKFDDEAEGKEGKRLPDLIEGEDLDLLKELEKSGIGRPSTYVAIMNKIQGREYTVKENGRLKPTELGCVISDLLSTSFKEIMESDFTAKMEDDLEEVADNQRDWIELVRAFWSTFSPTLEVAEKEAFVPKVETDISCPKCKEGRLQKVWFRSKYFYGCTRYPDCDFTSPIEEVHFNREEYNPDFDWDQNCPECTSPMKVRHGKFGPFLGCTRYPDCKGIVNIPKKGEIIHKQEDMPPCPAIDCPGKMTARRSRFGKTFFSCTTFPECDVIVNDLDQLTSKYPNHPRTAYVKKTRGQKGDKKKTATKKKGTKAKKTTRKSPVLKLSPEMTGFMKKEESTRQEVLKSIWDHIRSANLQQENNRRIIAPDATLKKLLQIDEPFDMMKLPSLIAPHFIKR